MKTHTSSFKEQIKLIGKEIDSRITFGSTVLGKDDLNAVTPSYQGAILKSVMKQLDIDSNVEIPVGTILKYEFGLKVNGKYEYINYGNYVVYSVEKQEDTNSYKIVCYDKLLYSMLDYVKLPITYPISVRDYIGTLSMALGLNFANKNDEFANYDKQIQTDLYDGLGYTFRDVLDELAQVTASTICLNNNDELEIRYITETGDTIDEEFLKDVNVNFGEKFGAVNTIVLSRSADSDSVYYPEVLPENPYEIKISDNQIMNGNDRADFLPDIYDKLNGLEFYTNDFVSTGIVYYDLCDRYSVKVGDNTYSCVMFNDEVLVTQGLEENAYTELPEQTETDYKHASKDDRMINQVYIIAKKAEAEILAVVNTTKELEKEINPTKDESGSEIIIEDGSNRPLNYLEIEGKSTQHGTPTPDTPMEINSVGYTNLLSGLETGNINSSGVTYDDTTSVRSGGFDEVKPNFNYIVSKNSVALGINVSEYDKDKIFIKRTYYDNGTFITSSTTKYVKIQYIGELTDNILMEEGTKVHPYIPRGKYGIEVKIIGKNLFKPTLIADDGRTISVTRGTVQLNGDVYRLTATNADMYFGEVANTGVAHNGTTGNLIDISSYDNIYYALSNDLFTKNFITCFDENLISLGTHQKTSSRNTIPTSSFPTGTKYITLRFGISKPTVGETYETTVLIAPGSDVEYEPYQERITVMQLNAPLRSLPNGVKDIAYIRNNKLYVDRYVSSVVLDGSEGWIINQNTDNYISCYLGTTPYKNITYGMSNYFGNIKVWEAEVSQVNVEAMWNHSNLSFGIKILKSRLSSPDVAGFKQWLSNHNTQVDYELAETYTEELGEIETLTTLKGYNKITTTNDLKPTLNIQYVRDTVIANYVENHITELKLNEEQIRQSVETVSSSVDGLTTDISRVEQITTDNSQVLNIISTNIDKSTGEVREVTTTTGFTFNAEGSSIKDSDGFEVLQTPKGAYYKDNGTITGQYTKDGSKQKDLELFGTYSYGKTDIDDTPMFVGQLYTDENGEECFGHFYNGGDY